MEHLIGAHRMVVEGDLTVFTIQGSPRLDEVRQFLDIHESIIKRHGRYACLVFSARMEPMSADVRAMMSRWPHSHMCYGVAIVGASFAVRTVIGLFMRALHLVGVTKAPTSFFQTEAEARDWLQKCRQQFIAASTPRHPS